VGPRSDDRREKHERVGGIPKEKKKKRRVIGNGEEQTPGTTNRSSRAGNGKRGGKVGMSEGEKDRCEGQKTYLGRAAKGSKSLPDLGKGQPGRGESPDAERGNWKTCF